MSSPPAAPPSKQRVKTELQARLDRYRCGDPRALACASRTCTRRSKWWTPSAMSPARSRRKTGMINEAEGYRNEQVALARGNAKASLAQRRRLLASERVNRAEGDASRFNQREAAFRSAPGPTETRLYLETMEQVLPGKKKLIVDSTKARRQLYPARGRRGDRRPGAQPRILRNAPKGALIDMPLSQISARRDRRWPSSSWPIARLSR